MTSLFYELVQVSIGTRTKLSYTPSATEWCEIYALSKMQAIIGISFYGVHRIYLDSPEQTLSLSEQLKLKWMTEALSIQRRNETLNNQCRQLQDEFRKSGFQSTILKGQGVSSYYNKDISEFRQSGDIDIWVKGSWRAVMTYVNSLTPNREFDKKHTHFQRFPNTIVEVHWWPSVAANPLYRKSVRSYYREQVSKQCAHLVTLSDETKIYAPDAKFETVHVLYHIFNHFLYEGVGLRQFMDLYFVLVNGHLNDADRKDILCTAERVGLTPFVPAVMWVLSYIFAMPDEFCIGNKDERLGLVLLKEIENGGNFGAFSKENQSVDESFAHRMKRRLQRRARLIRFNPLGVFFSPFTKISTLIWKRKVIRMYNL